MHRRTHIHQLCLAYRKWAQQKATSAEHWRPYCFTVDDSHPLLKTKQSTIIKYNLTPQGKGDTRNKITTVYMNPRLTTVPDMQRMSPTKLHEQVVDLLPAINNSDDEDGLYLKR